MTEATICSGSELYRKRDTVVAGPVAEKTEEEEVVSEGTMREWEGVNVLVDSALVRVARESAARVRSLDAIMITWVSKI